MNNEVDIDCHRSLESENTFKTFILSVILCMVASVVTSCASPIYRLYEGPSLEPEKIAILISSHSVPGCGNPLHLMHQNCVVVDLVDGKTLDGGSRSRFRIELLPGKHTLSVRYLSYRDRGAYFPGNILFTEPTPLTFYAEAGKLYILRASAENFEFAAWVECVQ